MELTPQQRAAIEAGNQKKVIATAGSGKTALLVEQAVRWSRESDPASMTIITFTRRAGEQLRSRLEPEGISCYHVGTVHAFLYRTLSEWGYQVMPIDWAELVSMTEYVLEQSSVSHAVNPLRIARLISRGAPGRSRLDRIAVALAREFLDYQGATPLSRLPQVWAEKARDDKRFMEFVRARAKSILWDEFQDTSVDEVALLPILDPERLLLVGDPAQAIFGFRGASSSYLTSWPCKALQMDVNWRSGPAIVSLSNALRPGPESIAGRNFRDEIEVTVIPEEDAIGLIVRLIELHRPMAILARTNYEVRRISEELEKAGLDVLAISTENDRFAKFPWPEIYWLSRWATSSDPRPWVIRRAKLALPADAPLPSQPPDTVGGWAQMLGAAGGDVDQLADMTSAEFVEWYLNRDLQDQLPSADAMPDALVMTVHAAKGQEFDHVLVYSFRMPLTTASADPNEERSIAYVALTRARKYLAVIGSGDSYAGLLAQNASSWPEEKNSAQN